MFNLLNIFKVRTPKVRAASPKSLWEARYQELHADSEKDAEAASKLTSTAATPLEKKADLAHANKKPSAESAVADENSAQATFKPTHSHLHAANNPLSATPQAAKQRYLYVLTIVVSILIIVIGNRFIQYNSTDTVKRADIKLISAKVERIINVESSDAGFDSGKSNVTINFSATLLDGDNVDQSVLAHQSIDFNNPSAGVIRISPGDKVLLVQTAAKSNTLASYAFVEFDRSNKLLLLVGLFVLGILLFGRFKGLNTVFSLGLTIAVIFFILIPGIFAGYNIYLLTLFACLYSICMSFFLVIGYNAKSYAASLGCFAGVAAAGLLALVCNWWLKISGITGEETITLGNLPLEHALDLKALIFAAILIGALGAVMDVAMDITAALAQVKLQAPHISALALYNAGIEIGQDLLVTLSNTLIMAYVGASLAMVLLLYGTGASLQFFLNREAFAVEILNAIIGTLAILLTIPLTSLVCAVLFNKKNVSLR